MRTATRVIGLAGALALAAGSAQAQNNNDSTLNNGADFVFFYSSPSSGFSSLAFPPDVTGDLFWTSHSGAGMMNDVDALLGSAMEVDGYFESLFDTDWATTPHFYTRNHGPALPDSAGTEGLEPAFFQVGLGGGVYGDVVVTIGASGLGTPCTVAPSLCSGSAGTNCASPGYVMGYVNELAFGSTPGSGIVLPADGTSASDTAVTYFVHGGMSATGGICGLGDYDMNDLHSVDETQADPSTGAFGVNPSGGFQIAGGGPAQEALGSMAEGYVTFRGNLVQMVADTGTGLGVETADNGGGAMNGRNLSVGSGAATLGVEIRDLAGSAIPNIGIAGLSLTALPNPGLPALGGNLLVLPDGLFNATSGVWQGAVAPTTFWFTSEGAFSGAQLAVPTTAAGATVHCQGATFSLTTFTVDSTNAVRTRLLP